MAGPTDAQRAAYKTAADNVIRQEAAVRPVVELLQKAIEEVERPLITPAREALQAVLDDIGDELHGTCIFCDKPIFSSEEFVSGDELMCLPCSEAAWAALTPEERAARMAEIEAEDRQ